MTYSTQEPKIIGGFDYLEFLIDDEWKKIPSQGMLEALIHFPKPDAPDPYRLEHYRRRFELRNRNYDSKKNQQILRASSNQLINNFVKNRDSSLPQSLEYISKIKYITHPFEVDASKLFLSIDGNTPYCNHTPHGFLPYASTRASSEGIPSVIQWFLDNKLSYEKYLYGELMGHYCFHILPMTTSRYTAISGKLETAERKSILDIQPKEDERRHLERTRLFFDSLQRRFPEFRDIFGDYTDLREQMLQDKDIADILGGFLNDAKSQIRRDKANKSRIEKELGSTGIVVISQCVFCYKFHRQTTKKRAEKEGEKKKGASDKEEKGKTSLKRYCPECEYYNQLWVADHRTPEREEYPLSKIPLNGW